MSGSQEPVGGSSAPHDRTRWLARGRTLSHLVLVGLACMALAASGPAAAQPTAACDAAPTTVTVGETVTLDASDSENATAAEFDVEGDGTYEVNDSGALVVDVSYAEPGTYRPAVRVGDDANGSDTARCGTVEVERNQPPDAQLTVEPSAVTVGETVRLDASESADPDGTIVEYRFDVDGNGTTEYTTADPSVEHAYDDAGTYTATVTVIDDAGANATANASVVVELPAPVAACDVTPVTAEIGETVTIDASGSRYATATDVDLDGDGSVDRTLTSTGSTTTSYGTNGTFEPTVTARNDAGEDRTACGEVTVGAANGSVADAGAGEGTDDAGGAASGSSGDAGLLGAIASAVGVGDGGPGSPAHTSGTVLLLGAVGWLVSRVRSTGDDPRPRGVFEWRSDLGTRYAAGTLTIDDGDAVAVTCGFRPDLVLVTARPSPGAGEGAATGADGEAGVSSGIAIHTDDGIAQHALGVTWTAGGTEASHHVAGTDGESYLDGTMQSGGAKREPAASDGPSGDEPSSGGRSIDGPAAAPGSPPNRGQAATSSNGAAVSFDAGDGGRTVRITAATADGFELEAEDVDAGICYRAVRLPADVDVTVGTRDVAAGEDRVAVPVDGAVDCLLLDAVAGGGDGDAGSSDGAAGTGGSAWVAWSAGTAVAETEQRAAIGWRPTENAGTIADRILSLPVGAAVGCDARLGSHRTDPTLEYEAPAVAEHTLQFVALSGSIGRDVATGTVTVPAPESPADPEPIAVSLECSPALIEWWVVDAASVDTADGDGAVLSAGAATVGEAGLEQFELPGSGAHGEGRPVTIGTVTDRGFELIADGSHDDGRDRLLVYRAWPRATPFRPSGDRR